MQIPSVRQSILDKTSKICSGSSVVKSQIGRYSYIGNNCIVINTNIGKFCSIADGCVIGGASHPINWVSTSPVFHQGKNILKRNFSNHDFTTSLPTNIGNDVWIGSNCLIKSGVKISDGAIVGMGSVVTKDVGPYEIWAGNPARNIRKRFTEEYIRDLLDSEWWNYDEEKLERNASYFNNVNEFISSRVK
jgi:acetyltransferase-like isoleucine patch superfamily enzyme